MTDFSDIADPDCPECEGSGEGGFTDHARMTMGGPEHYTIDYPCECVEMPHDAEEWKPHERY